MTFRRRLLDPDPSHLASERVDVPMAGSGVAGLSTPPALPPAREAQPGPAAPGGIAEVPAWRP